MALVAYIPIVALLAAAIDLVLALTGEVMRIDVSYGPQPYSNWRTGSSIGRKAYCLLN
ncbi:hypothetical protein ACFOKI_07190 [Sphingomonas qilianensis]|uniref:Uncharacterized protein n=1 Tax=Sphingomonas qilianensis TaxID=1736690 RepID=A0ABU9XQS4_9SPHN